MTTDVMKLSYRQLKFASLAGKADKIASFKFTGILGFLVQRLCQRSLLKNVLYQIPSLHLQDLLHRTTTELHKQLSPCVSFGQACFMMTATHVQDFGDTRCWS